MMKEIAFQPGQFSPVVEVSQRQTGVPAPADTNFQGLEDVARSTLLVANASSRGFGASIPDTVTVSRISLVIGVLMAARNCVEQLLHVGVPLKVTTPLRSPNGDFLEPIVRAYNYYGHFELDGKLFVTRGLERILLNNLFALRQYATQEVSDGTKQTVTLADSAARSFSDIDLDFYRFDDSGNVAFGKVFPLKEYIVRLVKYIADFGGLDERLPLLQRCLDITTEDGLKAFLRYARTLDGWSTPSRQFAPDPSDKHKAAMRALFGNAYSSADEVIPVSKFVEAINRAYQLLRRVSLERSYGMKTIRIPKYEGGSASQLAAYTDDVLFSTVPLSVSDSTAAVGFTTSYGSFARYQSAPGHEKDELLRELTAQSVIKT